MWPGRERKRRRKQPRKKQAPRKQNVRWPSSKLGCQKAKRKVAGVSPPPPPPPSSVSYQQWFIPSPGTRSNPEMSQWSLCQQSLPRPTALQRGTGHVLERGRVQLSLALLKTELFVQWWEGSGVGGGKSNPNQDKLFLSLDYCFPNKRRFLVPLQRWANQRRF